MMPNGNNYIQKKYQVITKHFNFRVSGQKIIPATSVKYLAVVLNESLI